MVYDFGNQKGGGDFVMLNILESLTNAGNKLSLITSKPNGLNEAKTFFGRTIDLKINAVMLPSFLPHPYSIAFMAKKYEKEKKYDIFIFSDDVPKCLSDKKVACYVHYSHASRLKFSKYMTNRFKTNFKGQIVWRTHKNMFPRFYPTKSISRKWHLIANSTVTLDDTSQTFGLNAREIDLIYPPVASTHINELLAIDNLQKEDLVICLGRFEPEKQFEKVICALSLLDDKSKIKLVLMGFPHEKSYVNKIFRLIKHYHLEKNVTLLFNAERKVILNNLLRAKALVHPSQYEPFGICVVEGMAAGCIPIVRKGFNGPWLEITQRGRYGLGFETTEELAYAIKVSIESYYDFNIKSIIQRAFEFDETLFKINIAKKFQEF